MSEVSTKFKTGGQFLLESITDAEIYSREDFSEDQLMMASATKEFVEKELDPHREQFEKKDYKLIKYTN